jgi:DNA polymerase III subunit epsilon
MRQIFFDIETTGLSYKNGDRIVEIAAIEAVDKKLTGRIVHLYFNPERIVPAIVVKIHGLDNDFLDDKPKFRETISQFKDFVSGADEVIAHNGFGFDLPFVDAELMANGFTPMSDWGVGKFTDSVKIARAMGGKKNSLDALCDKYGVDRSKRTSHGAVIDCELLADVWYAMTKEINFDAPDLSKRQEEIQRIENRPHLRTLATSQNDIEAHESYVNEWKVSSPKAEIIYSSTKNLKRSTL